MGQRLRQLVVVVAVLYLAQEATWREVWGVLLTAIAVSVRGCT